MTAVIDQHLVTSVYGLVLFHLLVKDIEFLLDFRNVRLLNLEHVLLLHAAHFFEHLSKRFRVAVSITELRATFPAVIRTDRDNVAVDASVIRGRRGTDRGNKDQNQQREQGQQHCRIHLHQKILHY